MDTLAILFLLLLISLPFALLAFLNSHVLLRQELKAGGVHIPGRRRVGLSLLSMTYSAALLALLWLCYTLLGEEQAYADWRVVFVQFYALALLAALLHWWLNCLSMSRIIPLLPRRQAGRIAFRLLATFVYFLAAAGLYRVFFVPV